jgi:uncharacterized protein YcbX
VHCAQAERIKYFSERKHLTADQIEKLMERDEYDGDRLGQRMRDTFHLADAFVTVDDNLSERLKRLVRLLFGDPYASPT